MEYLFIRQAQIELWVLEAQAGNLKAFDQLYQHFYPQVLSFAYRTTSNKGLAQDAVQEAWLKLSTTMTRINDPAAFKTWLFKLTHWQVLDMVKSNKKHMYAPLDAIGEIAAETKADTSELAQAMKHLSLIEHQVIHLFYLEGFSLSEISHILNIASGTVKSRLFRAKAALKQVLDKD